MNTGEDNESVEYVSVKSAQTTDSSAISMVTEYGSEVPESITTTVTHNYRLEENSVINEFCSECFKKFERVAASHFCKNCPPRGKYLCNNCLKGHNQWTGHKTIYSLSDIESLQKKSSRKLIIDKLPVSSPRGNDIKNWLTDQPETCSVSEVTDYSLTTYEESENPYDFISETRDNQFTKPPRMCGTPTMSVTSTTTYELKHLYDSIRQRGKTNTPYFSETETNIQSRHNELYSDEKNDEIGTLTGEHNYVNVDRMWSRDGDMSQLKVEERLNLTNNNPVSTLRDNTKDAGATTLNLNMQRYIEDYEDYYEDTSFSHLFRTTPNPNNWIMKPINIPSDQNREHGTPVYSDLHKNKDVQQKEKYDTLQHGTLERLDLDLFKPDVKAYENEVTLERYRKIEDDVPTNEYTHMQFHPMKRPARRKKLSEHCSIM